MATWIGNSVGEFIAIDADEQGFGWGNSLWFRVKLQTKQPLPRGIQITVDYQPDSILCPFTFERLPDFCYFLGR